MVKFDKVSSVGELRLLTEEDNLVVFDERNWVVGFVLGK